MRKDKWQIDLNSLFFLTINSTELNARFVHICFVQTVVWYVDVILKLNKKMSQQSILLFFCYHMIFSKSRKIYLSTSTHI